MDKLCMLYLEVSRIMNAEHVETFNKNLWSSRKIMGKNTIITINYYDIGGIIVDCFKYSRLERHILMGYSEERLRIEFLSKDRNYESMLGDDEVMRSFNYEIINLIQDLGIKSCSDFN